MERLVPPVADVDDEADEPEEEADRHREHDQDLAAAAAPAGGTRGGFVDAAPAEHAREAGHGIGSRCMTDESAIGMTE